MVSFRFICFTELPQQGKQENVKELFNMYLPLCSGITTSSPLGCAVSASRQGFDLWRYVWRKVSSGVKGGNSDQEKTGGEVVLDTEPRHF